MSDALNYLLKVRPGAMESYFDFIKKSGTHLDARTRALISVITKVDAQTGKGFRQYLVRAMQAGATPNQIIDALLVAFPALGLSKIVWAIEIILSMDIPEFRPEALQSQSGWHAVKPVEKIRAGTTLCSCNGRDLILYRKGKEIKVYDNRCPHQATPIPVTGTKQKILTCPKHGWKFDPATGACIDKGNRPLRQLDMKIEDGVLIVLF